MGSSLLGVAIAIALLTASSSLVIPMRPVPLTLQTLAVALVGAALGWRRGLVAILVWLAAAAAGAPVLAGGAGGLARFVGPTAGYLAAFPIAGALVGWRVEHRQGDSAADAFATMLMAHVVCLGLGTAWLALRIGVAQATRGALPPLLPGALVKSAVGAAAILWLPRIRARR